MLFKGNFNCICAVSGKNLIVSDRFAWYSHILVSLCLFDFCFVKGVFNNYDTIYNATVTSGKPDLQFFLFE